MYLKLVNQDRLQAKCSGFDQVSTAILGIPAQWNFSWLNRIVAQIPADRLRASVGAITALSGIIVGLAGN